MIRRTFIKSLLAAPLVPVFLPASKPLKIIPYFTTCKVDAFHDAEKRLAQDLAQSWVKEHQRITQSLFK